MSFIDAVRHVLTHYAMVKGRARRSEYWNFVLFGLLLGVVCSVLDVVLGTYVVVSSMVHVPLLSTLASLAMLVPSMCTMIRRLHDTGKPGIWCLLSFVPLIGQIPLLIMLCKDSDAGENKYGPSPKQTPGATPAAIPSASAAPSPVTGPVPSPAASPAASPATGAVTGTATGEAPKPGPKMAFGIIALSGPLQGQAFSLEGETVFFGREPTCSVRFPQATPGVSGMHCKIVVEDGSPILEDLGSSYGTFMGDGSRVMTGERVKLVEGDELWLGMTENRFKIIVYSS